MIGISLAIFLKSTYIVFAGKNTDKAKNHRVKLETISGPRGDILADDHSLLSTTITNFDAYIDINAPAITETFFKENIDSLCYYLDQLFPAKSESYFKELLVKTRKNKKNRYQLLAKSLTHEEMRQLKKFPIFSRGRYRGGLIIEPQNIRKKPFNSLAKRTLGDEKYVRAVNDTTFRKKSIGIEGYYNEYLEGEKRSILKYVGPGGKLIPLYDASGMPERGLDIQTSINVHLQDITEKALRKQLETHKASHGCAVVMEVETGKIKAIANLSRLENGAYGETFNHAIGTALAPGSTLKLASLLALLEEKNVSLNETVNIGNGTVKYYNKTLRDSGGKPKKSILTLKEVIEKSSNVGTAKFVSKYFGTSEGEKLFTDKLYSFFLANKTGIDLNGEATPLIRNPEMREWSGISLPWLSVGYESLLSPIQILAFYNAIANKGEYMQPYLVTSVLENGDVYLENKPHSLGRICTEENALTARDVLKGVVQNGTGRNIKLPHVELAGKTGTAKILESRSGYEHLYQASFAGFFPADNPKYSCIVVVNHPTSGQYYGNLVAAPAFKDIAEHFYMHRETPTVHFEETIYAQTKPDNPDCKTGLTSDLEILLTDIDVKHQSYADGIWSIVQNETNQLALRNRFILTGKEVPNVRGMGLKDALYILENKGFEVEVDGAGKVSAQSMKPGDRYSNGDKIKITLKI